MKTCAFCGRDNELAASHCYECGTELPPAPVVEAPAELPKPTLIDPIELEEMFEFAEGFHHPDWLQVQQWIERKIDATDRPRAWDEAVLWWVNRLRQDLGGNYTIWL